MKYSFKGKLQPLLLLLVLILVAFGGQSSKGQQIYPDAPSSFMPDDGTIAAMNDDQTRAKPFTLGLGMVNDGSTPLKLISIVFVDAPSNVTLVATAISRPQENGGVLLAAGNLGYPPTLDTRELHRPYIFHPLHNAIVNPQEYVEAIVSLKSSKVGVFTVKGFLLTLEIDGQTYQHYYPTSAILCVEEDHNSCKQVFDKAGKS